MPLQLTKVDYSIENSTEIVRRCLEYKKSHVAHTHGVGPLSCCALMEVVIRGTTRYIFGNSQFKNEIIGGVYSNPYMKCHGEASATMTALESASVEIRNAGGDLTSIIKRVYIEMSPCEARCQAMLENLNPNLEVLYSFDHPDEVGDWEAAAKALCS